ncbi:sigma-70 family RNA polymerase sigma factor [Seonamhaeicola algicola]|uniref:Sigma-70 family RNA polymerase sigma factor n=1 Tax=Seonamhaeicola algicola TaxID=1719036 RepID=A0A5C7AX60_9FLAO|nr:sigma-70 family RNA polymerase sigma factor [Seonamhaeicola algicola]TXE12757.1 sigma-70 family RNA polymerase sigma factor [Seonamhaeicola algicola]
MTKEPSLKTLLQNSDKAFEKLYVSYKSDFMAFGKTFSIKEEDLIDIYQDTFLSFYENLLNGKITQFTSSIKTYIFSIGKFKIYEYLRKNAKLKIVDEPVNSEITLDNLNLDADVLSEQEQLVKVNFKKLGKQCQLILELFYLKGKTLKNIQIIENYDNTDVVKSQKSRCLRKLKQLVKKQNE